MLDAGLKQLENLSLKNQHISDIYGLSGFDAMSNLDLANNPITDISGLTAVRVADNTAGPLESEYSTHVKYTESGVSVREALDLWDMPVIFLLLAALLGTEWAIRRSRGLA